MKGFDTMYAETLKLIATSAARQPSSRLSRELDPLFRRLAWPLASGQEAEKAEERIWDLWMHYPQRRAEFDLERATRAIVALDFESADEILSGLLERHPDYAEAWNKRATLYYMQQRDEESMRSLYHALELEPRHFGALCGFAEICMLRGQNDYALFAFQAALQLNPHLEEARQQMQQLLLMKPSLAN
jgi:Tfp pilus assembly protein PilF